MKARPCLHPAAELGQAEAAPFVSRSCLVAERACWEDLPKIFSLQKLGGGNDRANGAHATQRPQALIHQCPGKGDGVLSVRIPVAIQGGEARRGQGFVDGCPAFYPGIAFRGASGEGSKFGREVRIDQARSEVRSVGTEWVGKGRSRGWADH